MRLTSRVLCAFSVALTVAVAGVGCTSQRGGSSGDSTTPTSSASSLTGPPLTLGFVTVEGSTLGSYPETRLAAQAAVNRANSALGGVDGRPLRLVTCATDGTPESSQQCANRLVGEKPVAVVGGIDFGTQAAMSIYESAHIPYVTGSPQLSGELNSKNAFALSGGTVAELLGITNYLTSTKHIRSAHALYVDLPGLLTAAIQGSQNILRKKGVSDVRLIAEKADAADFAPALTQAAAGDPDAIIVVFQAAACARIVQAAAALNITTDLYLVGACATPAVAQAAGGRTDHLFFASSYLPVTTSGGDADLAAFRTALKPGERTSASQGAYSTVLDLRTRLAKLPTPTADALTTALRASQNEPNVMAHPYTCDGKQISIFEAVCNASVRLLQWRDGAFADVSDTWQNGSELVSLIGS